MATFLDIGLLEAFDVIFPVLLVLFLVYAILHKTQVLGKSMLLNAVISVAIAFMVAVSRTLIDLINFMIPWFAIAIIFLVLLLLIFRAVGASEESIAGVAKQPAFLGIVFVVAAIILIAGLGSVLSDDVGAAFEERDYNDTKAGEYGSTDKGSFKSNVIATIIHPKVLGLLILFAVMVFAVILLSAQP